MDGSKPLSLFAPQCEDLCQSPLLPCQVITLGCIICGQQRQSAHQPCSLARREFPVYFSLTDPRTLVRRRRVWPAFFATYLPRFVETRRRSTTSERERDKSYECWRRSLRRPTPPPPVAKADLLVRPPLPSSLPSFRSLFICSCGLGRQPGLLSVSSRIALLSPYFSPPHSIPRSPLLPSSRLLTHRRDVGLKARGRR